MPKFKVIFHSRAERVVDEIYGWIRERTVRGANSWRRAYLKAIAEISRRPFTCPIAPESNFVSVVLRHLVFRTNSGRPYRIIFSVEQSTIHILYVRGPGQDWI